MPEPGRQRGERRRCSSRVGEHLPRDRGSHRLDQPGGLSHPLGHGGAVEFHTIARADMAGDKEGNVIGRCMQRHRHQEFICFLNAVGSGDCLSQRRSIATPPLRLLGSQLLGLASTLPTPVVRRGWRATEIPAITSALIAHHVVRGFSGLRESMAVLVQVRQRAKSMLLPLASPLLRRLQLLNARIEALERQSGLISPAMSPNPQGGRNGFGGPVDNLTRTWLRLHNEVSRLAASIPEAASTAAQNQLATLTTQLQAMEAASAIVQARVSNLETHLQAVAQQWKDDVSGRSRRVDDTLRFLLDRVEFVRREFLYELRYGAGRNAPSHMTRRVVESRILAPARVEAARASGPLRLNIGCGHISDADYINVDMRELPGVDIIADVSALPFAHGTVDEISSAHLVEHFPQEELRRQLLPHWRELLKPGGRFRAITPDGEALLAGVAQGTYSFEDFRDVLFGGQDYEGDFHYNLLTPDSLRDLVKEAGFIDIEVPVRARRNGQSFEFELTARLPMIGRGQ